MSTNPIATVSRRYGLYLALLQLLFALTWVVYVAYLPALAERVGIAKQAVPLILLADQLIFVAMDFSLGVAADRVARVVGRLGPLILWVTLVSCAALLLLPHVAPIGMGWLFLGLTATWAITSSMLRAPPLALLGKYAERSAIPWLTALSLLGLGIASVIAPYLTPLLRGVDPRWPFALASLALAAAALCMVSAERALALGATQAAPASSPQHGMPLQRVLVFLGAVALLALGSQIHQFLNSPTLYLRHARAADLPRLMPVFWIGFNLVLLPAGFAIRRYGALVVMGLGALVAAIASLAGIGAGSLAALLAAQGVAGGAWACVMTSAVAAALAIGHAGREGSVTGGVFSMLAIAAAARVAIVAAHLDKVGAGGQGWLLWAPIAAFAIASLVLWMLARQRAATVDALA